MKQAIKDGVWLVSKLLAEKTNDSSVRDQKVSLGKGKAAWTKKRDVE